ncbi:MAG TPA: hypothetical protein VNC84_01745 [Gammaproteobacteria bacterium]|jgi:hypothetical protein|nr:hypothetical protein [Gammaproteobacteria bacterium]
MKWWSRLTEDKKADVSIYGLSALLSLLLSLWVSVRVTVINPDAICYLSSAAVANMGLSTMMHLCGQAIWPFYSLLIFSVSKITSLSYLVAANTIDAFFTAMTVVTFVAITQMFGASKRVMCLAAATILLCHQFNDVRQYIVRDHGYWAFYLMSIYFLLHFMQKSKMSHAIAWSVTLLLATLFRIEGAIFLITLPFVMLFKVNTPILRRVQYIGILCLPVILISTGIAGWLAYHPDQTLHVFGRVSDVVVQLREGWQAVLDRYQSVTHALIDHVLPVEAIRDAGAVWMSVLLFLYLQNISLNLSLIYTFLFLYALQSRLLPGSFQAKMVVIGYALVNLVVTFVFFIEHLFLAKRYMIALTLTLMLWVPFALERLLKRTLSEKKWILSSIVSFCICVSAAGGIFDFGRDKTYIRQAGDWLAENVPPEATLYANDHQLMYYSQHFKEDLFIKFKEYDHIEDMIPHWQSYQYIALRLSRDEKDNTKERFLITEMDLYPLQTFSNRDGDQVIIFTTVVAPDMRPIELLDSKK